MLKKFCKRALSTFLVVALIFTTFFIFDPTALFPKADALLEGTELTFCVPEIIYMFPDARSYNTATAAGQTSSITF